MKTELRDFVEVLDKTEKLDSTETRKGSRISLKGLGQGYQSRWGTFFDEELVGRTK